MKKKNGKSDRIHPVEEYVTLEGRDYDLVRKEEAMARKIYCRPSNLKQRQRDIKKIMGGTDKLSIIIPARTKKIRTFKV